MFVVFVVVVDVALMIMMMLLFLLYRLFAVVNHACNSEGVKNIYSYKTPIPKFFLLGLFPPSPVEHEKCLAGKTERLTDHRRER